MADSEAQKTEQPRAEEISGQTDPPAEASNLVAAPTAPTASTTTDTSAVTGDTSAETTAPNTATPPAATAPTTTATTSTAAAQEQVVPQTPPQPVTPAAAATGEASHPVPPGTGQTDTDASLTGESQLGSVSETPGSSSNANTASEASFPLHYQNYEAAPQTDTDNDSSLGDDADSALGNEQPKSTASLTSSVFNYRKLHGRTYHRETGDALYWGTTDESHSESLDIVHHLFTLCLDGKLYAAQIDNPKRVLDIGTGTGIWAIDMADTFPDAEVTGTDISPIQPSWVPPNLRFEIEDCTQEWTFPASSYDFVHIRYLTGSVVSWTDLFTQAYRTLEPGGYLESFEGSPMLKCDDGTMPADSACAQWGRIFFDCGERIGRKFDVAENDTQRRAMEEAGFVDIQEWRFKVPNSGWAADPKVKEIGQYAHLILEQDADGFLLFICNVLGWTKEETQLHIAKLRKELRSMKYHTYYTLKVVVGRKP